MTRSFSPVVLLTSFALTGACTQFPELDARITPELEAAQYPKLIPLAPVLAAAQEQRVEPAQENAQIDGRIAALRARAAALRGSVLSGAERLRLEQGLR
ncbi:MAG: hypothetical protein ABJN72_16660 [Sulfitobacter sp.]